MLCSPPPATTLASSCAGSQGFCAPCCRRSSQRSRIHNRPKTGRTLLLHERLIIVTLPLANAVLDRAIENLLRLPGSPQTSTASHNVVAGPRSTRRRALPAPTFIPSQTRVRFGAKPEAHSRTSGLPLSADSGRSATIGEFVGFGTPKLSFKFGISMAHRDPE